MSGVSEELRAALAAHAAEHITGTRREQRDYRPTCRCGWQGVRMGWQAAVRAADRHVAETGPVPVDQQCRNRRAHWTRMGWPCQLCADQLVLPGLGDQES